MPKSKGKSTKVSSAPATTDTSSPDNADSTKIINFLIFYQTTISGPETVAEAASRDLEKAVKMENLESGFWKDEPVWGNAQALAILDEHTKAMEEKSRESSRLPSLEEQVQRHTKEFERMEKRVQKLESSSIGYDRVRQRLLDVFMRDYLGVRQERLLHIRAGNLAAHCGDAVTDAGLYESQSRSDEDTFVVLYGIAPSHAIRLFDAGDEETIAVLNHMATLRMKRDEDGALIPVYPVLSSAFRQFTEILASSDAAFPQDDPESDLGRAYWLFWKHAESI